MTGVCVGIGLALVLAVLVVRDQTAFKLTRLRSELLALRSEERRIGEQRAELERMVAQAGEALVRADDRQRSANALREEVVQMLQRLGVAANLTGPARPENEQTSADA